MNELDKVDRKLRDATILLEELKHVDSANSFYRTANSFLSAARSVISVLAYQFGLNERKKTMRAGLSKEQIAERKRFDDWFNKEAKAVLSHPLKNERDESIHRSGQADFKYFPKSGPGMPLHAGGAFRPARVLYGKGVASLPIRDRNRFVYVMPNGTQREASEVCQEFLQLIEDLVSKARLRPW